MKRVLLHDADSYLDYVKKVLKPLPVRPDNDLKPMFMMFFDDETIDEEFNNVYNLDRPHPDDGGLREVLVEEGAAFKEKIEEMKETVSVSDIGKYLSKKEIADIFREEGIVEKPPTFERASQLKTLLQRQKTLSDIPPERRTAVQEAEIENVEKEIRGIETGEGREQEMKKEYKFGLKNASTKILKVVERRQEEIENDTNDEFENLKAHFVEEYKKQLKDAKDNRGTIDSRDIKNYFNDEGLNNQADFIDKDDLKEAIRKKKVGDVKAYDDYIEYLNSFFNDALEEVNQKIRVKKIRQTKTNIQPQKPTGTGTGRTTRSGKQAPQTTITSAPIVVQPSQPLTTTPQIVSPPTPIVVQPSQPVIASAPIVAPPSQAQTTTAPIVVQPSQAQTTTAPIVVQPSQAQTTTAPIVVQLPETLTTVSSEMATKYPSQLEEEDLAPSPTQKGETWKNVDQLKAGIKEMQVYLNQKIYTNTQLNNMRKDQLGKIFNELVPKVNPQAKRATQRPATPSSATSSAYSTPVSKTPSPKQPKVTISSFEQIQNLITNK